MLMFIFFLLFMIPISVLDLWWLFQYWMFICSFMFFLKSSNGVYFTGFGMGIDSISWFMIMLSFWICTLMVLASMNISFNFFFSKLFLFIVLLLMISLYCTFSSMNLFYFYLFFEFSMLPTLLLILGWGYQPERVSAGMYLILYTFTASLPLLVVLLWLDICYGSLNYVLTFNMGYSMYFYLSMIMAFLVKFPLYMFHLWLPKAHVEAPVSGSMILAGVLLKLGGYGLIRVFKFMYVYSINLNHYVVIFSLYGGVLISLICLRQIDLKMLIAYSSVAHMSLVISGLFTMNSWGLLGSLYLMVGHGLCSSGLFCLSNIIYERLGSRLFFLGKGLLSFMPSMSFFLFLLSIMNMAFPPSLNLLGEISLFNSLLGYSYYLMIFLFFMSILSCVYSLYMYSYSQHGNYYSGLYSFSSGFLIEFHLIFMHLLPLNLFVFCYSYLI
uniref:NADH-ubiquinone oxidoreductase chain 4 n=1 Tax=Zhengitettix curvispinus TaxID=2793214 RepID=A0A7U3STY1_9ORTH|nr:NADH dehydrogenase subunit 4 [Zhengitettix curvispinus]